MKSLRLLPAAFLLAVAILPLRAVEIVTSTNSYFNTSNTISLSLPSWASGWGSGGDGWNYIGAVNGASGVYLGNGWVLTAGHVGVGDFTLGGNTYDTTGISYSDFTHTFHGTNQTADLTLFQISTDSTTGTNLTLSSLILTSNTPTTNTVVMIGNGGGVESWGINTITSTNLAITVSGYSYESRDFETAYGITNYANGSGTNQTTNSITNNSVLVGGDSGGGDFIDVNGTWELAGINEAVDTSDNSYFVQMSAYQSQITSFMAGAVPEPGTWGLLGIGFFLIALPLLREQWKAKTTTPRS